MNMASRIDVGSVDDVRFTGSIMRFAPIAITNLLLTVFSLGAFRFWAKSRERAYLWSNTHVIDDQLDWTGTGAEMLVGFLVALPLILAITLILGMSLPVAGALLPWYGAAAVGATVYGLFYFVLSFGRFRALRYRLSRSWWHGIRGGGGGGSGLGYAGKALGLYLVTILSLGLAYPWAQAKLWNWRWNAMHFGSAAIHSSMPVKPLLGPWAVVWLCFALGSAILTFITLPGIVVYGPGAPRFALPLLFYAVMAVAYVAYMAAFYRAGFDWLNVGEINLTLDADFNDWLTFYLTTILLTLGTLGLALMFYPYRRWRFLVDRLELHGSEDLAGVRQASGTGAGDAEGIGDSLEIGAF